jgi:hypothetical protein
MAAVIRMMSAVREEAAVISTEIGVAARTGAVESVASSSRTVAEVANPLAVRQVIERGVKEAAAGG